MADIHILVADDSAGQRLDAYLGANDGCPTRSACAHLIEGGAVIVNGETCLSKKYAVRSGDRISVDLPEPHDPTDVIPEAIPLDIRYEDGVQHMILNGADVTGEIRTPEMSMYASGVSAQPCVRAFLLDMQRQLARPHSVVMDGRDIGTVVLPKADVKIFLTASAEVRAKRRFDELQQKGDKTPYAQILAETKQRDKQDSERAIAPLKQAADAVLLDTSGDTVEQSVNAILDIVRRKLG